MAKHKERQGFLKEPLPFFFSYHHKKTQVALLAHESTCDKLCCYLLYFFRACFTILPHGLMRSSVIFMGGCIEMKGIHHILHTLDRALCHDINILVPIRTAHQDDIIRIILSDFRDDGFSVYLQVSLSQQFCSGLISATELKEIAFY